MLFCCATVLSLSHYDILKMIIVRDKRINQFFPDFLELDLPHLPAAKPGAVVRVARNKKDEEPSFWFDVSDHAFNGGLHDELDSSGLLENKRLRDLYSELLGEARFRIGAAIGALQTQVRAGVGFQRRDIVLVEYNHVEEIKLRMESSEIDTFFYDSLSRKSRDVFEFLNENETEHVVAILRKTVEVRTANYYRKNLSKVELGATASNKGTVSNRPQKKGGVWGSFRSAEAGVHVEKNWKKCLETSGMVAFIPRFYRVVVRAPEYNEITLHVSNGIRFWKPDALLQWMNSELGKGNDNVKYIPYKQFQDRELASWGVLLDVSRLGQDEHFRKRVDEVQKRVFPSGAAPEYQQTRTRLSWWKALLRCVVLVVVVLVIVWWMRLYVEEANRYTKEEVNRYKGEEVNRLTKEEVNRYTGEEVHRNKGEEVNRPTREDVNGPTKEEVNRYAEEEVNRCTEEEVNRPTKEDVNRYTEEDVNRYTEEAPKLNHKRWIEWKQLVMPIGVGFVYAAEKDGEDAETSGFLSILTCALMTLALVPIVASHPFLKKFVSRLFTFNKSKQQEMKGIDEIWKQLDRHGFVALAHSPDALYDDGIDPFLRFVKITHNEVPEPVEFHYPRAAIDALLDLFLNDNENEMTHNKDSPKSKGSSANVSTDDETEVNSPARPHRH